MRPIRDLSAPKCFSLISTPMLRHLAQPFDTAVLVLRVSRKAHFDSPPIIVRIRSVTTFNSASISASRRGGLKT